MQMRTAEYGKALQSYSQAIKIQQRLIEMQDLVDHSMTFVLAVRLHLKGLAMYHIVRTMYDNSSLLFGLEPSDRKETKVARKVSAMLVLDSLIWDDIVTGNLSVWGDEKAFFMVHKARQAFAQSIKTLDQICAENEDYLLDFKIFNALLAGELGIIARCIKRKSRFEKPSWLNDEEDKEVGKTLNETMGRV